MEVSPHQRCVCRGYRRRIRRISPYCLVGRNESHDVNNGHDEQWDIPILRAVREFDPE